MRNVILRVPRCAAREFIAFALRWLPWQQPRRRVTVDFGALEGTVMSLVPGEGKALRQKARDVGLLTAERLATELPGCDTQSLRFKDLPACSDALQ